MTPRRLLEPGRLAGPLLLAQQTDARLVDLVRSGQDAAFEAIVRRYDAALLRYARRILPEGRAEDAVQQAFLNAHRAMRQTDQTIELRPWLFRITHNQALNLLRQNGWTHEQLDPERDGVERPEEAFERRESLRSALAAVSALPERQRDALILRELEGRSYDEIALELKVSGGAVRQLLSRARATLQAGVSSLTPWGLLLRLPAEEATAMRAAELVGGAGAGALALKLCAAAAVTGAVAVAVPQPPGPEPRQIAQPAIAAPLPKPVAAKPAPAAKPRPKRRRAAPAPAPPPTREVALRVPPPPPPPPAKKRRRVVEKPAAKEEPAFEEPVYEEPVYKEPDYVPEKVLTEPDPVPVEKTPDPPPAEPPPPDQPVIE